jgi:hypothetical protein
MPDRKNSVHKTGDIPVFEGELARKRDADRPRSVPEMPEKDLGSTTGSMSPYVEPEDDTALRDEDAPA